MTFTVFSAYFEKVMSSDGTGHALLTSSLACPSSTIQWVCPFLPSMPDQCLILRSITPSITSLVCTRVFLELRGLFLHSGTEIPPPYASGTLPSYNGHGYDGKDHLGGSRRRDHRNLSLDFFVSDTGGMTAQSTSAGTYEFTTFGHTTEVGSGAGFPESPSNAL